MMTMWLAITCCLLPFTLVISMVLIESDPDWSAVNIFWMWPLLELLSSLVTVFCLRW